MAAGRESPGSGSIGRAAAVLVRSGDFGTMVLGRHGEAPVTLAGTGVSVWEGLARPRTLDDLVSELARDFDAEPATVRADVAPVVDELLAVGVLEHRR